MGEQWKQWEILFLGGSEITADSDCNHEIKWHLLLGRKAMTNPDSVLKSRDITLLTEVHKVKAMVFPVAMYGCESWTIKTAERQRFDAFELWCWEKTLESPLDCKKIKPVNPKENPWIFIGRTDAEAETPILRLPDAKNWLTGTNHDAGKYWRQEKGTTRGWNAWMASPTQWTWVWAISGSWWWIGKPGALQSMVSQRAGNDWATELTESHLEAPFFYLAYFKRCS